MSRQKSRDGHTTNALLSTDFQFKLGITVFVGCPEGCRFHTASAVYDLVYFFIHRSFSETTRPILTKFSGIVYSSVV